MTVCISDQRQRRWATSQMCVVNARAAEAMCVLHEYSSQNGLGSLKWPGQQYADPEEQGNSRVFFVVNPRYLMHLV